MTRRRELAANLAQTSERIERACGNADRDPREITVVVVTKTYPASDVDLLVELGIRDIGENRHPEAGRKMDELRQLRGESASLPRCHFLGGLQTNKAGAVARYADVVHSVDRAKLAASLSRGAVAADREIRALVQIDFGEGVDVGRSGVLPEAAGDLADQIAEASGLILGGVMTVAPLGVEPEPVFARLAEISAELRERYPSATDISAGMSADFEQAIKRGATHLRIGRSILGERPSLR